MLQMTLHLSLFLWYSPSSSANSWEIYKNACPPSASSWQLSPSFWERKTHICLVSLSPQTVWSEWEETTRPRSRSSNQVNWGRRKHERKGNEQREGGRTSGLRKRHRGQEKCGGHWNGGRSGMQIMTERKVRWPVLLWKSRKMETWEETISCQPK